jgi:hypothetical protein
MVHGLECTRCKPRITGVCPEEPIDSITKPHRTWAPTVQHPVGIRLCIVCACMHENNFRRLRGCAGIARIKEKCITAVGGSSRYVKTQLEAGSMRIPHRIWSSPYRSRNFCDHTDREILAQVRYISAVPLGLPSGRPYVRCSVAARARDRNGGRVSIHRRVAHYTSKHSLGFGVGAIHSAGGKRMPVVCSVRLALVPLTSVSCAHHRCLHKACLNLFNLYL